MQGFIGDVHIEAAGCERPSMNTLNMRACSTMGTLIPKSVSPKP